MDLLKYNLTKNQNPEITKEIEPLIELLKEEWDIRSSKPFNKTMENITRVKIGLQMIHSFIWEDNWKETYVTMKKYNLSFHDFDLCFRGNPEKKEEAKRLYRTSLKAMISYLESKMI